MQVVGVDFGTTNVRISTWDSEQDLPPQPSFIGAQNTTTMPAVVALRRETDGEISVVVGEEADALQDEDNRTLVIRNIKRIALSTDAYVAWHLGVRNSQEEIPQWPPTWWSPQNGCVQAWGHEFPVWQLIRGILAEGFRRARLEGEFEWRAGCPVHADLSYREGLAQALSDVTGKGNVDWVSEEPILFLTLARRLGDLGHGSYLVFDFGGGSFDCALVEVDEDQMLVYGADGHPLLGGSDLDEWLTKKKGYRGQPDLLRKAKEQLTDVNPSVSLGQVVLTLNDVEEALEARGFTRKSLSTAHDAYIGAKTLWKRGHGEDDPPIGEIISRNITGAVRCVWQLTRNHMAEDVDKIILFGGPTRLPSFRKNLSNWFGSDKVITAAELLPALAGTPDLELVGISMGACYSYTDSYSPLYLNRLPAHVTLEDLESGDKAEYVPFQNFAADFRPFAVFVSSPVTRRSAIMRSGLFPKTYQLSITYPNGLVLSQEYIDEKIDARLIGHTLRLIIDRYGRVGIEQQSVKTGPRRTVIVGSTPWQTTGQAQALHRLFEHERRDDKERTRKGLSNINRSPWNHPTP